MNLNKLVNKVEKIVKNASKICNESFNIDFKDGLNNIVTTADLSIQKYLNEQLLLLIPDSSFYEEESEFNLVNKKYLWIIDPIDGTENFSRGIKDFVISVALAFEGEVVLGVCYVPKTDELFSAIKGQGSYLNGKKIRVSKRPFNESLFLTAFSLYKKEYAGICIDILKDVYPLVKDFRRFGSCANELCMMAKGEEELFFEIRVFLWDYAAAVLILKEAGGCINVAGTLKEITPVIAANNLENYQKLYDIVMKHLGEKKYE